MDDYSGLNQMFGEACKDGNTSFGFGSGNILIWIILIFFFCRCRNTGNNNICGCGNNMGNNCENRPMNDCCCNTCEPCTHFENCCDCKEICNCCGGRIKECRKQKHYIVESCCCNNNSGNQGFGGFLGGCGCNNNTGNCGNQGFGGFLGGCGSSIWIILIILFLIRREPKHC